MIITKGEKYLQLSLNLKNYFISILACTSYKLSVTWESNYSVENVQLKNFWIVITNHGMFFFFNLEYYRKKILN